ncbi:MAG: aminotransferase class I/II-fold pyridoxal phosphate-dependent enzyme [Anaerolineae bacterium]|nr:aminotransferase class I/II-fold pyridoxal phosphate-dependent enzyme [Anaerolineae bacterium]NUQ02509.1 aminotransferase class I/II-fold pyridoxal phosphate-dependent enzyme [Anaerolineae bacterium]
MPAPASRLGALPPYPFATLNQRVRELNAAGHNVLNIDIGNPDMPPPDCVVSALERSASDPRHHGYSGYKGTAIFREAVARYYARRFDIHIDPETQVLPLLGSKEGIVNLTLAYVDRGDSVLVPDIGYPAYSLGAYLAGASVSFVPVRAEHGFRMDLSELEHLVSGRTKIMWVNFPNNPTGAVCDGDHYQELVNFCRRHDVLLASDNPYVDVTYDEFSAGSVLQADGAFDTAVEFISFSKTYNMAGWRLGAAVGSARVLQNLLTIKSNVDSGHFEAIYDAGISAIDHTPQSWINARNATYQRRRDLIIDALPHIGLVAQRPLGSLYIWAKVVEGDGTSYAEQALTEAYVSLAPGAIYGPGGVPYVRMSVAIPDQSLDQALSRLKAWYAGRH